MTNNSILLGLSSFDIYFHNFLLYFYKYQPLLKTMIILGGGRNIKFQNVDRPKISERRNGLFSWSLLQHHNVENGFWVDQNYDDQNVENSIKNRLST